MSSYRKSLIKVLKDQQIQGWEVGEHGQAIVIKIALDKDLEAIKNEFPETIEKLSEEVKEPKEWTKVILYNGKDWFQYVIN
jgi:hypothetical protein